VVAADEGASSPRPAAKPPRRQIRLRSLGRSERLSSTGFGATAIFLMAPALFDALDSALGIALGGVGFRNALRWLSFIGVLGFAIHLLAPRARDLTLCFEDEELLSPSWRLRRIAYANITAAHVIGSGATARLVVGVRRRFPFTLPLRCFPSPADVDRFLDELRTRVALADPHRDIAGYDLRSRLGHETASGPMPVTCFMVGMSLLGLVAALATRLNDDPLGVLRIGALSSALVRSGEYERLVSHVFVHWNATHLWANVATLLAVGWMLERLIGWRLYALLLLAASLMTSLGGLASPGGVLRVGSSGTVSAALGMLFWLNVRRPAEMPPLSSVPLLLWLLLLVVQVLVLLAWALAGAPTTGIDHAAHAWGWLVGAGITAVIIGRYSIEDLRARRSSRLLGIGATLAAVAAVVALGTAVMRAVGMTATDRVRSASVLLLARETPPSVRDALVRAMLRRPMLEHPEMVAVQTAASQLLRERPYDPRTLETMSRVQARLGRSVSAFEAARAALIWSTNKEAAAAGLVRLLALRSRREGILFVGPEPAEVFLEAGPVAWNLQIDASAAVRQRGLLVFALAGSREVPRGLVLLRVGRGFRDRTSVTGIPPWVCATDPCQFEIVAMVTGELVHAPEGSVEVDAYRVATPFR